MLRLYRVIAVLVGLLIAAANLPAADYWMYVGTYTGANLKSKGIYAWRFDSETGKLTPAGLAAESESPSFLAVHPNGRVLYAVNEISKFQRMRRSGSVSAFAIDAATSKLRLLNRQASAGDGPCHIALDSQGKCAIVANYNNGSVAAFTLGPGGELNESTSFFQHRGTGTTPHRQEGPHAHCVAVSQDSRFALVADLGLDRVMVYTLDAATGLMAVSDPPFVKAAPGAGPRHLAFHPDGQLVYLINEMGSSIVTFAYDTQGGKLKELQTVSTLPKDFKGQNDDAEIQVHPSGKFVYGSNRGADSIAVFAVDPKAGTLTPVEQVSTQGKTPRNFAIDPTGAFLLAANQSSNNIVVFRIDQKTGRLTATGEVVDAPSPVCLTFVSAK